MLTPCRLCWLVPAYWLLMNFFFIILVAPWLATPSAAQNFYAVRETQAPHTPNSTWFWFFQVVSAYTNTGLSLIDTSMIQLADQYFMLIPIGTLIMAGNTAFPIILRFFIWTLSKIVPRGGRSYETLHFLLDHPRRCFVYLFPSAQTWFLLFVLVVLK
jgi:Trk-type K+ transport system membrane component